MSGQGPTSATKVRRNVSPSQRQGPMKAVKPFILKGSPSRSPSSPNYSSWHRRSPVADRHSPDRNSPCTKVEKPKAVRVSPASSSLRRTSSLDTIGPIYLKGQWPADVGGCHHTQQPSGPFMADKTTQTSEDWHNEIKSDIIEKKKKKHRRSASFGNADKKSISSSSDKKLGLNSIRQKLQKTKDQGTKQRSSPIPGNHNALLQTAPAVLMRTPAIGIPMNSHIPKPMSRYQRSSVEGLNNEIEMHMVNMHISGAEEDKDIPDGHRAPVPEVRTSSTRSIDTQTPSHTQDGWGSGRSSESPTSPASRPQSISPACAMPIMLGHSENSPRPSINYDSPGSTPRDKSDKETGDSDSLSPEMCLKKTSSPKPNKIVREPPDGCEKVKVFDEDRKEIPTIKEPLFCPIKPHGQFILKPSSGSAFCPLKQMCTTQGVNFTQSPSIQPTVIDSQ